MVRHRESFYLAGKPRLEFYSSLSLSLSSESADLLGGGYFALRKATFRKESITEELSVPAWRSRAGVKAGGRGRWWGDGDTPRCDRADGRLPPRLSTARSGQTWVCGARGGSTEVFGQSPYAMCKSPTLPGTSSREINDRPSKSLRYTERDTGTETDT